MFVLHDLLSAPLGELAVEDLAELWAVADHVVRLLETRKEDLRLALLDRAKTYGSPTEKGHRLDVTGGMTLRRTLAGGKVYLPDKTEELLAARSLPTGKVIYQQTKVTPAVRTDALEGLWSAGYLSAEDLESVQKPLTETLTVDQDPRLLDLVEERLPLLEGMKRKGSGRKGEGTQG